MLVFMIKMIHIARLLIYSVQTQKDDISEMITENVLPKLSQF